MLTDVLSLNDWRARPPHLKLCVLYVKVDVLETSSRFCVLPELPICAPPARECALHRNRWNRVVAGHGGAGAHVLEPGFVDEARAHHVGFRNLHRVLGTGLVVGLRLQVEIAHALLFVIEPRVLIAHRERVAGVDRVIHPRAEHRHGLRRQDGLVDRLRVQVRVESGGQDEGVFGGTAAHGVDPERGLLFLDRTAQVGAEQVLAVRRPLRRSQQGAARIQRLLVVLAEKLHVNRVRARLGKNLDAAEAGPFVLGRERIGIDADFADGGLVGQVAAGKAIDVDLSAVGPGARSRHRLQRRGEFVGIVGERR